MGRRQVFDIALDGTSLRIHGHYNVGLYLFCSAICYNAAGNMDDVEAILIGISACGAWPDAWLKLVIGVATAKTACRRRAYNGGSTHGRDEMQKRTAVESAISMFSLCQMARLVSCAQPTSDVACTLSRRLMKHRRQWADARFSTSPSQCPQGALPEVSSAFP